MRLYVPDPAGARSADTRLPRLLRNQRHGAACPWVLIPFVAGAHPLWVRRWDPAMLERTIWYAKYGGKIPVPAKSGDASPAGRGQACGAKRASRRGGSTAHWPRVRRRPHSLSDTCRGSARVGIDELMNGAAALGSELVVVLDNLESVTSNEALSSIDSAIARLPPNARIVLLARVDPALRLARLRARRTRRGPWSGPRVYHCRGARAARGSRLSRARRGGTRLARTKTPLRLAWR